MIFSRLREISTPPSKEMRLERSECTVYEHLTLENNRNYCTTAQPACPVLRVDLDVSLPCQVSNAMISCVMTQKARGSQIGSRAIVHVIAQHNHNPRPQASLW